MPQLVLVKRCGTTKEQWRIGAQAQLRDGKVTEIVEQGGWLNLGAGREELVGFEFVFEFLFG